MIPAICTTVSKNYLAYARCLADSFLAHHPQGQVFVLLVDEIEDAFDPTQERFTTILAKDLGIAQFEWLAFRYFVYELNTAVKPFLFEYLFKTYGCQKLFYIDPDIQFHQPLDELMTLLDTANILLLPHLTGFVEDDYLPNEISILRSGTYNLGFLGIANRPEVHTFLHWWQRKLRKYCTGEQDKGLFLDQRWIDLVPGLFSNVHIHRDPGYNVAYWNLNHREITATPSGYMVNGKPLKFYHFSGFNFDNVDSVARYQNRYILADLPVLAPLYYAYRDRLVAHNHLNLRSLRYAYSYFDNDIFIPEVVRYLWRTLEDEGQIQRWPNPLETGPPDSFIRWLNEPGDQQPDPDQPLLTRLSLELYQRRPDLQAAFPNVFGAQRTAFARWFVHQVREESQIDDFFIEPVRKSLAKTGRYSHDEIPASLLAAKQRLSRGARTYLTVRDFLNDIGLGQRLRAMVGPERVFKVRQTFFKSDSQTNSLLADTPHPTTTPSRPELQMGTQRADNPFGLNIVGYMRDETGIGEVARSILKALHQKKFPVAHTNIKGYDARQQDDSVTKLPAGHPYSINLLNINADQLPVIHNALDASFFQNKYNIGFWFWELPQFPEMWRDRFRYVDEVWVGSSFVQGAIAQVAPVPVVNVRVPILPPVSSPSGRSDFGLPPDKHLFLFVFDGLSYIERKNPFDLIEAYKNAFEPYFQDTTLVIKATNLHRNPQLNELLRARLNEVSGILIEEYLDRSELNSLFALCDTYVSLHRSEGFGMTLAESMLSGKAVIATAYSANMDFMTPSNSYLAPYRLVELEQDYGPYQKGNVWAQPDVEEAALLMQRVVANPIEAKQKGQQAKADIQHFYCPEAVAEGMINRLQLIRQFRV